MVQFSNWHMRTLLCSNPCYITVVPDTFPMLSDYTFDDYINDASDEDWVRWENEASKLELPLNYYIMEFVAV